MANQSNNFSRVDVMKKRQNTGSFEKKYFELIMKLDCLEAASSFD